jgi:mRNA-degrading endonuclease YafQ of YafQ-DinJ toxin-antitoxin module
MIRVLRTTQFKRDVKRIKKQGKSTSPIEEIVNLILEIEPPPPQGWRIPTNYRLTSSVYLVG